MADTYYDEFLDEAEQGEAEAQYNLGNCYYTRSGAEQDYAQAVHWYEKAAEQGNARAQTNLGYCYSKGEGVAQDFAKATYWFEKAAEQGEARAQFSIAVCYYAGRGVAQDYAKAVHWFTKAAEQGDADAQCNLGYCYSKGEGVAQDLARWSVYWYTKAAKQGHAIAKQVLHDMQKAKSIKKSNQPPPIIGKPAIGSTVSFADIAWRVLAVEDEKALLISENILEKRKYDPSYDIMTWETCTLRRYLNGQFYYSLDADISKIAETKNSNPGNQWYKTDGGNATTDKIFLLSLDEAVKYCGDSGQLTNRPEIHIDIWRAYRKDFHIYDENELVDEINDEYNCARMAKNKSGKAWWWWLRSPGRYRRYAASVCDDGTIQVGGCYISDDKGGVRPAMWLNL